MMKKVLPLVVTIAGIALLFASVGFAEIPAPPVNQTIGFDDVTFNAVTEAECRVCHEDPAFVGDTSIPDRHHLLYGSAMPQGQCSADTGNCTDDNSECADDTDCTPGDCSITSTDDCHEDGDCPSDVCSDDEKECEGDGDSCTDDTDCDEGTCSVTTATSCRVDGDCPPTETCEDAETCDPKICHEDGDCTGTCGSLGETCVGAVACVTTLDSCFNDADCTVGWDICSNSGDPCVTAEDCPRQYQHPTCGQPFCAGSSAAPNNPNNFVYGCLSCHDQDTSGGVTNFVVYEDCTVCHVKDVAGPSVHHLDETVTGAKAGNCVICHGDVVDDPLGCMDTQCPGGESCVYDSDCDAINEGDTCEPVGPGTCDDEHLIPTYAPSLVTPDVSHDPAEPGNCNYCHDAGDDTASGVVAVDNHDTHHGAGVYKNRFGGTWDSAVCEWCHKAGNPHSPGGHDADRIRNCENCHGMESLHNIQADSPNVANVGTLVVGAEDGGYGHVGANNPGGDDDCWGCHGFAIGSVPATTGPITPALSGVSPLTIVAGTATQVTLTGVAFTNTTGATKYTSNVIMTAADGSSVTLTPESTGCSPPSEGSMSLTIPGTTAAGIYTLQLEKLDSRSNAVSLMVVPAAMITAADCGGCSGVTTIEGAGFGDAPPAGVEDFINVTGDGITLEIISWTDTEIKVTGGCTEEVTVNTLFDSATK